MSRLKNHNVQASISSSPPSTSSSSSLNSSSASNEKTKLTDLFDVNSIVDGRNINIRWNSINFSDNHHHHHHHQQFSDKNSNPADCGESSSAASTSLSESLKGINQETPSPSSSTSSALYMNPAQTDLLDERTVSQVDIVAKNNNDQVALDDEIIAVQNNLSLMKQNQNKVESNNNNNEDDDGGIKHALNEAATFGAIPLNDIDSDGNNHAQQSSVEVSIITEPNHHQQTNLKPILKRKDSIDLKNQSNIQPCTVLPPPILKKRDSIVDNNCPTQCSNFTTNPIVGNAASLNQQKPLSILKNRQTKLSYSFDDNIGPTISTTDSNIDDQCSTAHQLKPILKKKSWSIEEKANVGGANGGSSAGGIPSLCDGVKGILKSSDKSTSTTTSSSSRNSILDETSATSHYSATDTTITAIQAALNHRTVLKSILKSSYKNRSTSLSPCNSTDSLVDDLETYRVSLPHNLKSASFRKRTSLDSNTTVNLFDFELFKQQQQEACTQPTTTEDNSQISVINIDLKPILKRNSFDSQSGEEEEEDTSKSTNPTTTIIDESDSTKAIMSSFTEDQQNGDSDGDSRMPSSSASSNVTLRASSNGNNETLSSTTTTTTTTKVRPKSCFVSSKEINNSISERLALLKRNGEHAWKTRIQKAEDYFRKDDLNNNNTSSYVRSNDNDDPINPNDDDDHKNNYNNDDSCINSNSLRQNALANRVSSLLESQTKWKNRVPEKDAKQFTVTSKLSQTATTTPTTTPKKKNVDQPDPNVVVLRETSKRSGLRGSSLSEKKLGAISSKLNSVFGAKGPFGSSATATTNKTAAAAAATTTVASDKKDAPPSPKEVPPAKEFRLTYKTSDSDRKSKPKDCQPIVILKPDDEESFGSFFDLGQTKVEQILSQPANPGPAEHSMALFDCLEDGSSSIKLLSTNKRSRISAPKRRAASEKNPAKLLAKTAIAIDTYQPPSLVKPLLDGKEPSQPSSPSSSISSPTKVFVAKDLDSKYAISALAGLASVEDFKSVASNLRRSSSGNNSSIGNDCWRTFDLKNSLQPKMLIMVKGRRKAHTRLIEPSWLSLNQMDSFILVTKTSVFAYIGRYSNIIERTKCMEIAELIRKRKDLCLRSSNCELKLIDCQNDGGGGGGVQSSSLFDSLLPLLKELDDFDEDTGREEFSRRFEQTAPDVDLDEDDEFYEEFINHSNMVYVVNYDDKSDAERATLKLAESYSGRSPRHQILQPDSALIFDFGSEMYVWLGKGVSNILRKKAMEAAKDLWLQGYDFTDFEYNPLGEKYLDKGDKRPDWTWFIRVNQNMEPILFKDKFFNWPAFTLTRPEKNKKTGRKSSFTDRSVCEKKEHRCVKKDLSAELNLFPVDVLEDMINKTPKVPELILEFVPLGRGAGDVIQDEDGLPVKVISLDMQSFYIDHTGNRMELSEKDRNFLCSGESYYIRWKYRLTRISRNLKTGGESRFSEQHGGRDRVCYFVWQGRDAKNTKRGVTALNAIEKLRVEGASQTYVEHGSEDPVFLRIFEASLVIQNGKRNQIHKCDRYRMFMLNDTDPKEEFIVELECNFKNLRSRTSYMFVSPGHSREIYLWHGCKSKDGKRKSIRDFVEKKLLANKSQEFGFVEEFDYKISEFDEGQESKEFMEIFTATSVQSPDSTLKRSSKSNLHRDIYFSLLDDPRPYDFTPRLFHFVTMDKIFQAIEIVPSYRPPKDIVVNYPFVQDDLYERAKCRPTFFLFDAEYEVYLWESKHPFFIYNKKNKAEDKRTQDDDAANDDDDQPQMIDIENEIQSESNKSTGFMSQLWLAERKCALETTLAYCHAKNASEPPKSYVICAGLEPDAFCGLFPTWTYYDNVAKSHIEDGRKPGEQILVQEMLSQIEDINQSTYSYEELKRRPLPEGINILCLESYLDDEEFEKVFSMNREEFCSLPTWKQKIMKQEKELF